MKHIRNFFVFCQCSDCDGSGRVEIASADTATREVPCPECAGSGEVRVVARDSDFEAVRAIDGAGA